MQSTLDGSIYLAEPYCAEFGCGARISEVSTQDYLRYVQRMTARTGLSCSRCAVCEIEFARIVFGLTDGQVRVLKKKWIRG